MDKEESVFQFDLRESVYFKSNQQVSEITGISLEPEISIQTYGDYISIRGVIALYGEYQSVDNSAVEQMDPAFEQQALRYIDTVEEDENGLTTFSHQFPVEISVPLYRIDDLNDVAVNIDAFDYALPDPAELIVEADIAIHGISNDDKRDEESNQTAGQELEDWESFQVELKQQKDDLESPSEEIRENQNEGQLDASAQPEYETERELDLWNQNEQEEIELAKFDESSPVQDGEQIDSSSEQREKTPNEEQSTEENEDPLPENTQPPEESSSDRWKWTKTQSFDEFFGKKLDDESSVHESSSNQPDSQVYESYETSDAFGISVESSSVFPDRLPDSNEEQLTLEGDPPEENETTAQADISYLSDMFQSREEDSEQQFAKMKLCIVQDRDTLESIAERYQLTSMHIIKRNSLESENISPGQLLYIPVRKKDQ